MINIRCVKRYCTEYTKIENYDLAMSDTTQTWDCHHRNERFYTSQELKDLGLYYDCPPCELIFITKSEHMRLHMIGDKRNVGKKKPHSEEWKKQQSNRMKGNTINKGRKASEETKIKMSEAHKGQQQWYKGHHWKLVDGKRVWY